MSDHTGKTGIEIHIGLPEGQKVVGRMLHALHLEKLIAFIGRNATAVIVLDGVERREPLYEAHFLEAAAVEHELSMHFLQGPLPGPEGVQKAFTSDSLRVTVEPATVTVVEFTPRDGFGAELKVLSTRPV